jgi:hypothetical protein
MNSQIAVTTRKTGCAKGPNVRGSPGHTVRRSPGHTWIVESESPRSSDAAAAVGSSRGRFSARKGL